MDSRVETLAEVTVVHLGVGMAAALVSKYLADLGAAVVRVEPPEGDPFAALYPAYDAWLAGARLDRQAQHSPDRIEELLAVADVCVIGGEDYPGIERRWSANALSSRHPRLVILDIEGAPPGLEACARPATDLLIQARSGLVHEQYNERPIVMSFSPASYGAAMRGLVGVLAALYERQGSAQGQVVATSLLEGAWSWLCGGWCAVEKPSEYSEFRVPKSPTPLVFRTADDCFIHLVIGAHGSKYRMYQALDIDDPSVSPTDSGIPRPTADTRNFYGDIDLLSTHVARKTATQLLESIWLRGLPAEPVWPPGRCWDEPQIQHNGIIVRRKDGTRHVGNPLSITALGSAGPRAGSRGCRPLEGIRVVDFGAFVAGPFGSALLADLGADVIKVETIAGDPHRTVFRFYTSVNRGKRSIALDLKHPEGRQIAHQLCAQADVVMSNFRPGVTQRLGIDPQSLQAINPDVVVLESPAYGISGPLAQRAGFDMVMQAYCGHEWRAGGEGNDPMWSRTSMVDFMAGFLGASGVIAALYRRTRRGGGLAIVSPLVNAGIALLSELVQAPDGSFHGAPRLNPTQTGYRPSEALYPTLDGSIALVVRDTTAALGLIRALSLGEMFKDNPLHWSESEATAIGKALSQLSTADALRALEAHGVWCEACRKDVEHTVLNDPGLQSANVVQVSNHPDFGEVRELGAMLRFSRSRVGHQRHAPLLGEDSEQILAELGRSQAEIQALITGRVTVAAAVG
ncbi:Formyl-CoA:oxalate CoA-transferase [Pseudomonas fluorescens]|uniref:Formyl-CoA:oxalate CoA-transferase n=2 Tax=Pseudomonas fluorescens TaxID=294 RepID=A0A5E7C5L2_PSEFL|nr:Formyl-CoA:oxalate CoA-transferase [Pseudomonas fluorescens]